jgi:Zn-dependent protease
VAVGQPEGSSLFKDGWSLRELEHELPLTRSGKEAVDHAQVIAARAGAARVEPGHLLVSVLTLKHGLVVRALKSLGKQIDVTNQSAELGQALATAPGRVLVGPAARYVLFNGLKEAELLGHHRVDSLHIFLGLLYRGTATADELARSGVTLYELRQFLQVPGTASAFRRRPLPALDGAVRVSPVLAIPVGAFVLGGTGLFFNPAPDLLFPLAGLFIVGGWITSVCVHEFAHALLAYLGGDRSVVASGYLTFNPLKYVDPLLSVVVPLAFVLLSGFGLPGGGVYINRRVLRTRWLETASSLAGPVAQGGFAILLIAPFWFDWERLLTAENIHFWSALAFLAFVLVSSVVLNLLPVPGIDGFGALMPWLPVELRAQAMRLGSGAVWLLWILAFTAGGSGLWHAIYSLSSALHIPLGLVEAGRMQLSF